MTLYSLPSYNMTPRSFAYGPYQGANQTGTPNTTAYVRQQKKNTKIAIASVITTAALLFFGSKTKLGKQAIEGIKKSKVFTKIKDYFKDSKIVNWIKGAGKTAKATATEATAEAAGAATNAAAGAATSTAAGTAAKVVEEFTDGAGI